MHPDKCAISWCHAYCTSYSAQLCAHHLEDFTFSHEGQRSVAAAELTPEYISSMLTDYVTRVSKEGQHALASIRW